MTFCHHSSQTKRDQHERVGQQIRASSRLLRGGRTASRCSSDEASTSPTASSAAAAQSVVDGGTAAADAASTSAADAAAVFESAHSRIGSRTIRSIGLVFEVDE